MRYVPNDKYTIAWFKLAECVAKGEKEKAFGVYRLLMHSLDDQAYAFQLEGDLLGAFQDQRAVEKYAHAAQCYVHNNRFKEAAALYYDLVGMVPDDQRYVQKLIDAYKKHKQGDVLTEKLIKLADGLLEKARYAHVVLIIQEFQQSDNLAVAAQLYQKVIIECIKNEPDAVDTIDPLLQNAIAFYLRYGQKNQLQELLVTLKHSNSFWHDKACEYLKDERD